MSIWVRFERGRDCVIGPTYGPYPFVQLTYGSIRVGPDGDDLAHHSLDLDDWVLVDQDREDRCFSDVIIYDAERAE